MQAFINRVARLVALALIVSAVMVGLGTSPASASPQDIYKPINSWGHLYEVGNCEYRVRYGNFGSAAYAQVRVYGNLYSDCINAGVILLYNAGSGVQSVSSNSFGPQQVDLCNGAFQEAQATAPVTAFASAAVATMPGGVWKIYAADGNGYQAPKKTCHGT